MRTFTSSMLNSWSATHKQSLLWCSCYGREGVSFLLLHQYFMGCPITAVPDLLMNDFGKLKKSAEWGEGRRDRGQFFYCLILFFFAKKESHISFLADGNMTMCKILSRLVKSFFQNEQFTPFYYQNYFWQLKTPLTFYLIWLGMKKSFQYFRPFSTFCKGLASTK